MTSLSITFMLLFPACLDTSPGDDEASLDDIELSEIQSEIGNPNQWQNDTAIADKTSTRPVALASWKNRVYMTNVDYTSLSQNEILLSWFDGSSWNGGLATGRFTTTRPALATYNDRLTMVYRPSGETGLKMTSTGTLTWTSPVAAGRTLPPGGYSVNTPQATVIGSNLYVAYCMDNGSASYVNVDKYDGTSWSAFKQINVAYSRPFYCASALIAAMPDTGGVEVIWTVGGVDPNNTNYLHGDVYRQRGTINRSSTVWYATEKLPMYSYKPIAVVSCAGETHLVHGGFSYDTQLWWSYRSNGNWVTDQQIPNQWSSAGPALGCLNDTTTLLVHNSSGSTRQLMQSIFAP